MESISFISHLILFKLFKYPYRTIPWEEVNFIWIYVDTASKGICSILVIKNIIFIQKIVKMDKGMWIFLLMYLMLRYFF